MAAMAQLDCGQCGYLCQTYAEAVWSGAEADIGRCVPGGRETQRKLKELMTALESQRDTSIVVAPAVKQAAALGTRERPALATMVDAYPLTRSGSEKDVRHVVFDLSTTDVTYEAGDSLGVYARKNPQLVQAVLDRLGASGDEMVAFDGDALPLRQVLLAKVDIARPSDDCLEFLASRAFNEEDVRGLIALTRGEGKPELADADLLDLLMAFPSVMPSLPGLLKSLDRLQPRLYSIASSPKAHPREVHLTVSAVRWDSNDRQRTGIGSCYLADFAKPGDVIPVFVQKSHGFGPPADDAAPAIMVGPGTGIAPFRAFLEEREARAAKGRNWLFFGDQKRIDRFPLRGPDHGLAAPRRAAPARHGLLARPGRQDLRPAPHAGERRRAVEVAGARARTSMSAATPSAWPRTSRTRCCRSRSSRAARARTRPRPGSTALAKAAATSATSTDRHDPHHLPLLRRRLRARGQPRRTWRRRDRRRSQAPGQSRPHSAPRARRSARRCRSRTGCFIPRSTAGACRGTAALDTVADGFRDIIARHGPDAVAFYVSGQLLTEDYYAANKLIKGFLGTANIDTNSRLCMASSVAGHKRAFGSDTVPGLYEDFELADLVVLVGSNLAWCHPVLFQRLEAAKRARPAMKVVVIDPRRTETCDIADLHLALRPGSDVALVQRPAAELHAAAPWQRLRRRAHDRPRRRARARRASSDVGAVRPADGRPRDLLRLVRQHREDRHALFAGREPVERRRRQGERASSTAIC